MWPRDGYFRLFQVISGSFLRERLGSRQGLGLISIFKLHLVPFSAVLFIIIYLFIIVSGLETAA